MTDHHREQPSLRRLAASLGVSHGALSGAFRAGRLRRGLELDGRGRLQVTDAALVAQDWRAGRVAPLYSQQREKDRAAAWTSATADAADVRLEGDELVVGHGEAEIALDPVGLLADFLALGVALDMLAFSFVREAGAQVARRVTQKVKAFEKDEHVRALMTSAIEKAVKAPKETA